jgi:spore coat protein U-like protein
MSFIKRNVAVVFTTTLACMALWTAGDVQAATATANLAVTANVTANCTISTTPAAFGAYDPIFANATAALDATGGVVVACTKGASTDVRLGQGANAAAGSTTAVPLRQMASGTERLAYFLYSDAGRTTVWGDTLATSRAFTGTGATTSTLTVYGRIPAGQNVAAGAYADTVVATITF